MAGEWKSNIFGLVGILVSLLAFVNEQDRLLAAAVLIATVIFYSAYSIAADVNENEERIKKVEEKLQIYKDISYLKADMDVLKKEVKTR
ncbi:hypothetical protein HYU15_00610 [Candidatus Woesearchaeota archaeon]|nr:hypothetical protein [Candidatus Woesearchaeota archaeon]